MKKTDRIYRIYRIYRNRLEYLAGEVGRMKKD
jgi:hypothetical protein